MSITAVAAMMGVIALALTCTMFVKKQAMLGFPSALFWALFGAQFYMLSITPWDTFFDVAFAAFLGMIPFTMYGAWGLREGRVTAGEDSMAQKDDVYIDEEKTDEVGTVKSEKKHREKPEEEDEFEVAARPSRKARIVR
jgi:hypothetical protein